MFKSYSAYLLCLVLPLIVGCGAYIYVPIRPPVPLLTQKGELNLSGGVHFPDAFGFDFQAAYAFADHWSAVGTIQGGKGKGMPCSQCLDNKFYSLTFGEFGLGHFGAIGNWDHETYLLGGFGSGTSREEAYPHDFNYSGSSFRLGLQQNIGIQSETGTIAFGLGAGYERFFALETNDPEFKINNYYDTLATLPADTRPISSFYVEPIFFWSVGSKYVKWTNAIWWSIRSDQRANEELGFVNLSTSISINLGL